MKNLEGLLYFIAAISGLFGIIITGTYFNADSKSIMPYLGVTLISICAGSILLIIKYFTTIPTDITSKEESKS